MSRSNPNDAYTPNPCSRWFEWEGAEGGIEYYDKETKQRIKLPDGFTFIVLDELGTVIGWHDASESAIYSNEVRDTKQETFLVKSFKGGVLAEGIYSSIRERVTSKAIGGKFATSCYIAFRSEDGSLKLGNIKLSGAVLNMWVEFKKACPTSQVNGKTVKDYYVKAVKFSGISARKKGTVNYAVPDKISLVPISDKANEEANAIDKQLQEYLKSYFANTRVDQVATPPAPEVKAATVPASRDTGTSDADADRIAQQQADKHSGGGSTAGEDFEDEIPF